MPGEHISCLPVNKVCVIQKNKIIALKTAITCSGFEKIIKNLKGAHKQIENCKKS